MREASHLFGVLVLTGQKNNDRIALLRVVALGQMHDEVAGKVFDVDLFLHVLRAQGSCEQQCSEAGGEVLQARPGPREQSRPHRFRPHFGGIPSRFDCLTRQLHKNHKCKPGLLGEQTEICKDL